MQLTQAQRALTLQFGWHGQLMSHPGCNKPLVSVIIPTFNCLRYLPQALRSVQQQWVDEIEIMVLDDGSTDDTWRYLQLAAECDKRIRPVGLAGVGVARARNIGLKQAKGQFIAFLDADDHWGPRKLHKQLAFHQANPDVTLSFSNYLHFDPNNQALGDCFSYWPRFSRLLASCKTSPLNDYQALGSKGLGAVFAENVVGTSCVMISFEAIGKTLHFDETLGSAEDWDFWLQAAMAGEIACCSSIDMGYLMRPGSETSKAKLRLKYMALIQRRYFISIAMHRPSALLSSVSRLLTGYAEYYRSNHDGLSVKTNSLSLLCHSLAFLLYPSKRLFRASISDLSAIVKLFRRYFYFANSPFSILRNAK